MTDFEFLKKNVTQLKFNRVLRTNILNWITVFEIPVISHSWYKNEIRKINVYKSRNTQNRYLISYIIGDLIFQYEGNLKGLANYMNTHIYPKIGDRQ
jgi:hypothetical protein